MERTVQLVCLKILRLVGGKYMYVRVGIGIYLAIWLTTGLFYVFNCFHSSDVDKISSQQVI